MSTEKSLKLNLWFFLIEDVNLGMGYSVVWLKNQPAQNAHARTSSIKLSCMTSAKI